MEVRYLQRMGVPTSVAIGQGPLTTVIGTILDVILLFITASIIGTDIETSDIGAGNAGWILLALAIAATVIVAIVLCVEKVRNKVIPPIIEAARSLREIFTDLHRFGRLLSGLLLERFLFALTLGAALAAFGESQSLATLTFVNTAASLFAAIMPVPGNVGVAEAAITAMLISVGVPESTAFAAALTHRLATFYLPPIPGWFALKWLRQHAYL